MKDITDFSMPIHKAFMQEDLLLGVQKSIFLMLFLVLVLVSYLFSLIPGIILTTILYIPCRILTKKDPNMISIALNSLLEPDKLEG